MPKVDPNDKEYDKKEGYPLCGEGRKLLAPIGFERYQSQNGNPMIGVRFLVLRDYADDGDDANTECYENFTNTPKALFRIARFARALGQTDPFDTDDDEELGNILVMGYVEADVEVEEFEGKSKPRPKEFHVWRGDGEEPEWSEWIDAADTRHTEYLVWRAEHPRGTFNKGGKGGGSSGGSGGARPSSGESGGRGARKQRGDDVPF